MNLEVCVVFAAYLLGSVSGFFFDRGHQQQQQQQQGQERPADAYQRSFLDNACPHYLCPGTLVCVKDRAECPCEFPNSQLRCPLPNGQHVCISKPATHDQNLHDIYDDPIKGPLHHADGLRDCGWVLKAYEGKV